MISKNIGILKIDLCTKRAGCANLMRSEGKVKVRSAPKPLN
jgi:hypothetical protein